VMRYFVANLGRSLHALKFDVRRVFHVLVSFATLERPTRWC
jgi:hypothetical protein